MTTNNKLPGKILIVDDNEDLLKAARIFLKRHFSQVDIEKNPDSLPNLLSSEQYDIILLDMNFTTNISSGKEGFYWMDQILELDPSAVIVLITAYGDVQLAVKAIKEGATDFVLKPWDNEKLLATLYSALKLRESKLEIDKLKARQKLLNADHSYHFQEIIGQSPSMLRMFDTIQQVAATDANILILGENGTGKELVARALHQASTRSEEAFISVDLGSLSETLFQSELFGHVKGAFTDAQENRAGRFEIASGGTVFLDEIGNLSLPLQAKLLTVLQNRQVTRVGANRSVDIDIRLICATNMPIYDLIEQKQFRQDLLYRINTIEIELPPLHDRLEDIPLLAEHFINHYSKKYQKRVRSINPATIKRMEKYPWPGNVRELQHAIERAVIMTENQSLQPEDLFFNVRPTEFKEEENVILNQFHLEEVEKILIRKVLKKHNGNITHAAMELGLTRSSLYRRLERYGI